MFSSRFPSRVGVLVCGVPAWFPCSFVFIVSGMVGCPSFVFSFSVSSWLVGVAFFSVPCEIMGGLAGVIAAVLVSCLFAVVYRVVDCDGVFPLIV